MGMLKEFKAVGTVTKVEDPIRFNYEVIFDEPQTPRTNCDTPLGPIQQAGIGDEENISDFLGERVECTVGSLLGYSTTPVVTEMSIIPK